MYETICRQLFGRDYSLLPIKSFARMSTNYIVDGIKAERIKSAADIVIALASVREKADAYNAKAKPENQIIEYERKYIMESNKIKKIFGTKIKAVIGQKVEVKVKKTKKGMDIKATWKKAINAKTVKYLTKEFKAKSKKVKDIAFGPASGTFFLPSDKAQVKEEKKKAKSANQDPDRVKAKMNYEEPKSWKKFKDAKLYRKTGGARFIICTVADEKKGIKFSSLVKELREAMYSSLSKDEGKKMAVKRIKLFVMSPDAPIRWKNDLERADVMKVKSDSDEKVVFDASIVK